jgi:hypothetical protein
LHAKKILRPLLIRNGGTVILTVQQASGFHGSFLLIPARLRHHDLSFVVS